MKPFLILGEFALSARMVWYALNSGYSSAWAIAVFAFGAGMDMSNKQ